MIKKIIDYIDSVISNYFTDKDFLKEIQNMKFACLKTHPMKYDFLKEDELLAHRFFSGEIDQNEFVNYSNLHKKGYHSKNIEYELAKFDFENSSKKLEDSLKSFK